MKEYQEDLINKGIDGSRNLKASVKEKSYCVHSQAKAFKRRLKPATTNCKKKKLLLTLSKPKGEIK